MSTTASQPDLLFGAEEIAKFLGTKVRRIYNFASAHGMPHFHAGRLLCARKAELLRWISEKEKNK